MSDKPSFEEVWVRIRKRAGEAFFTKTGIRFTYCVEGERLMLNRINYSLSKGDLMKAYPRVPMEGPSEIASMVGGLLRLGDPPRREDISEGVVTANHNTVISLA